MRNLMLLAGLGFLLGILSLLAISRSAEPAEREITAVSERDLGKTVVIRGRVSAVSESNGNYFLTICAGRCLRATVFARTAARMREASADLGKLKKGSIVLVEGVVREYRGALSLEAADRNSVQVEGG